MTFHDLVREVAEKASHTTTVAAGTFTGIVGWIGDNWLGLAGLLIAAASFAVNWYYSHKRQKILELQHQKERAE